MVQNKTHAIFRGYVKITDSVVCPLFFAKIRLVLSTNLSINFLAILDSLPLRKSLNTGLHGKQNLHPPKKNWNLRRGINLDGQYLKIAP